MKGSLTNKVVRLDDRIRRTLSGIDAYVPIIFLLVEDSFETYSLR